MPAHDISHNTPALGALADEAASFPDGVPDSQSIHLMPAVDSSAPRTVSEARAASSGSPSLSATSSAEDSRAPSRDTENSSPTNSSDSSKSYPLIHKLIDAPQHLGLSGRIINVLSNLPHAVVHNQETDSFEIRHRRGNSALYSALQIINAHDEWESLLVGWAGEIESPHTSMDSQTQDDVDPRSLSSETISNIESLIKEEERASYGVVYPVWLSSNEHETEKDGFQWRSYAESIIWPILHYIQGEPTDGVKEQGWWRSYIKLNEAYAEKISEIYKPGDIIWVHDYYLLMLPQLLRMRNPKAYISLFLHSPFPSSEYFRLLPKRKDLLEGMLGANLVATQAYNFSRHFISACTRLLGLESRPNYISAYGVHVSVDTIPIGIDVEKVEHDAFSVSIDEKVTALRDLFPGKKLIIGRDRLDSVRGVAQKLYAYEMFLNLYPEWVGKVVLIQVTSPAYSNTAKTEKKIAEMISHINGTYGTLDYSPIQHYPKHVARDEYFALLRAADLGLITSVRDGMNTTSLEFVVCQKNKNSPLVLSEFTGTAGLLVDSIQVNPWDSIGVAQTINQCLMQSDERNSAIEKHLYQTVATNTVQDWVTRNISRLIHNLARHDQSFLTPTLDRALLSQKYENAKNRLFLFDYDGTLTPIVREPSAAVPSARLYKTLELLTKDPRNHVWIISGRDTEFLDKWLGSSSSLGSALGFSAEHGCFIKESNSSEWANLAKTFDMSWREEAQKIFNYFTERTQGSHIETKQAAITWHHRRADPEFGAFQAKELKKQLERKLAPPKYDVEVMEGKANIEVRPRKLNKGEIVKSLIEKYSEADSSTGKKVKPDFIFCLGDDKTDEDMFKAIRSSAALSPSSSTPIHGLDASLDASSSSLALSAQVSLNEEEDDTISELNGAINQQQRVSEKNKKAAEAAYERGAADGLFPVTVGPANKKTTAAWHLIDPEAVLESLAVLTGEISLEDVPSMGGFR